MHIITAEIMASHRLALLALALLHSVAIQGTQAEKTWTYVLQSVEAYSSDPDSIDVAVSRQTVGRNMYTFSGVFDIKKPLDEETMIEAKSYRSVTGNSDYKPIPFQIQSQNYKNFLNGFYKECFMPSVQECSNLPYFEGDFQPPLEQKRYELNSCMIDTDKYPDNLASGYYKMELLATGSTSFNVSAIVKIDQKLT